MNSGNMVSWWLTGAAMIGFGIGEIYGTMWASTFISTGIALAVMTCATALYKILEGHQD